MTSDFKSFALRVRRSVGRALRSFVVPRDQIDRLENMMTTLAEKIQQVEDAFMAERKDHAAQVESLKAQLKAAWESDHEEDYQNSIKEMDELIEKLKQPAPAFQPSAN